MKIWTSSYRYDGPYRLDITVRGNDQLGKAFAPTWEMVMRWKQSDKTLNDQMIYIEAYHKIIINHIVMNSPEWQALRAKANVVLVCFCPAGEFCHRHLLVHYLKHYGAEYCGEITGIINNFHGEYSWLSNFAPCKFEYQGIVYPTTEHFFQAWKFPVDKRAEIAALPTPGAAKRAGRKAELSWNWETVKLEVMKVALECKFHQPVFRSLLLRTKDMLLIEGNTWHDNFWGDCNCAKCAGIPGGNALGRMLMEIRATLK